jgi:signal peptidase
VAAVAGRSTLGRPATIVLNVAAVLGLLCVAVAAVAVLTGMRIIIFSTGSMTPTTPGGSLAVTVPIAARDIAVGDVISAPRAGDGALVTHRVVSIDHEKGCGSCRCAATPTRRETPLPTT